MKRLSNFLANLKISSKIWLCMLAIGLVLSAFLGLLSSWYFAKLYQEDTRSQTADSLQIGSQALGDSFQILLDNVIGFASDSDFSRIVADAHNGDHSRYVTNRGMLQNPMQTLTLSNPLIETAAIIGKNGEFYSVFTNTLKKSEDPSNFFGWDLSSVRGLTWLSVRQNPFIKGNAVIPIVIPVAQLKNTRYLQIAGTPADADVFILLLLDSKRVTQRLALSNSSYSSRVLYITDSAGRNLSLEASSPYHDLACSEETVKKIGKTPLFAAPQLYYGGSGYNIYGKALDYCSLRLVCILPNDSLHQRIARMNAFILILAVAGLCLTTLLSFVLARFVTKPFMQLISNVKKIENNCYDTPHQMKYQDEIGHLNMAINSMYATIQQQFECMKQSERAKYRSEIQLLTEQINPHFLYNTLECIHMEVLSGHKKAAASMINSLGTFIRIGLSYGSEVIPVTKEIAHVKAYIDIMNNRFNRTIDFRSTIDAELGSLQVLKSILQPLAENSIRHGFDVDVSCYEHILMPTIEIQVHREGAHIVLEVMDNGRGIDLEQADLALHPELYGNMPKQHVGLNNVYQRLRTYYGDASVVFETIPYFKNTVRLIFPANQI